ncbi:MAG: prepilin-type N-terminal cleavage/methylation domain-containing protein [Phycisphaerae bacterium]
MRSRTGHEDSPPRFHRGLSLIEVLVVVAIIALLLTILLPSMHQARQQARTSACAAKLQQLGRAGAAYQTVGRGWFPGSPWSTGYSAMNSDLPGGDWPRFSAIDRLIVDWFDYATPLRVQMQGARSIPHDRNRMLVLFTSDVFNCDSNPHTSVPFPLGTPGPVIRSISYLAMLSLMRSGPEGYERSKGMACMSTGALPGHVGQRAEWEMSIPAGYYPRIDRIGRESLKVFLADGFRFYDEAKRIYDYDFSGFRSSKGIGNVETPPCAAGNRYNEMYNVARRYAYRHGDNDRINALMFDGHVGSLRVDYRRSAGGPDPYSGYTGEAVHPKHYYPSGTVVRQPDFLHQPLPAGLVLP